MTSDIRELNNRRARAAEIVRWHGMTNVPTDPDERIKSDAAYRLALDAAARTEAEYQAALSSLTTDELLALTQ